jgi:hypothetical protein
MSWSFAPNAPAWYRGKGAGRWALGARWARTRGRDHEEARGGATAAHLELEELAKVLALAGRVCVQRGADQDVDPDILELVLYDLVELLLRCEAINGLGSRRGVGERLRTLLRLHLDLEADVLQRYRAYVAERYVAAEGLAQVDVAKALGQREHGRERTPWLRLRFRSRDGCEGHGEIKVQRWLAQPHHLQGDRVRIERWPGRGRRRCCHEDDAMTYGMYV